MAKKQKLETVRIPKGVAKYPWLTNPDTKFNSEGNYKVTMVCPNDDPEVIALCEKLDASAESYFKEKKAELEKKGGKAKASANKLELHVPYETHFDEEGNETDYIKFSVKMKALYKDGNDETVYIKPGIFDSKGKEMKVVPAIYGGSILKVNASILPVYVPSANKAGVSLRLNAVQILELVSNNGRNFGFDDEGNGFVEDDYQGSTEEEEEEEDNVNF